MYLGLIFERNKIVVIHINIQLIAIWPKNKFGGKKEWNDPIISDCLLIWMARWHVGGTKQLSHRESFVKCK